MRKLPFGKALLYIAVVKCRIDFEQPGLIEFMQSLNEYFPFIEMDSPYTYVRERLDSIPNLPATVVKGTYNKNALHKFLKETDLANLHDIFDTPQFMDLLYDLDLRRKIEVMAITGFRPLEIELEIKASIPEIDLVIVKAYLDCFINYQSMNYFEKKTFITSTFEEPAEKNLMLKCLETKSKDTIRIYLNAQSRPMNHIEMVNTYAHIITLKIQEGLITEDDFKVQAYLKHGLRVADSLDKFGAGNQDAAKQLLDALAKRPEDVGVKSPKPMSVEQLEDMYLQNIKTQNP